MAQNVLTEKQEIRLKEIREQLTAIGAEHANAWDAFVIHFHEEIRPNRGCTINVVYIDSDYVATAFLDPYGNGPFSWGYVEWVHNGADDECSCDECVAFSEEEEDEPADEAALSERFGSFWKPKTVSERLSISEHTVQKETENHRFLCVETSDGFKVYPEFQFNNEGSLPTTLPKVLNILLPASDGWTTLYWLTSALEDFGGRTAVEVLSGGDKKESKTILAMAEEDASGWQNFQQAEEPVADSKDEPKWIITNTSGGYGVIKSRDGSTVQKKTVIRPVSLDVQRLRGLIDLLVQVIEEHGGSMNRQEATREVATKAGISVSELPYVITSAVADKRITASLRTNLLEVVKP